MSFDLKGLQGVQAQLEAISAEMAAKALVSTMREVFKPVLAMAKSMVPVDSGDLRDSLAIATAKPKEGDTVAAAGLIARSTVPKSKGGRKTELPPSRRWHFIELGTKNYQAHPYARPALNANAQSMIDALRVTLAKKIEEAVKRKSRGK
jgi:HK97 gp10 family phage protein